MEHKALITTLSALAGKVSESTESASEVIEGRNVTAMMPERIGGCSNSLVFGVWWKLDGKRISFHKLRQELAA